MRSPKRKMPAVGKCFDHLGGQLAPMLFTRLLEMEWIKPEEGKKTVFEVTEKGKKRFKEVFNIDVSKLEEYTKFQNFYIW
jgi:predicted transcriptional regulator